MLLIAFFGRTALEYNIKALQYRDFLGEITAEQTSSLSNTNTPERAKEILAYVISKYGGNYYELYEVIKCESNFRHEVYGDSTKAFGIAQFHKNTWDNFNKRRGTNLDYYSMEDQIDMMVWSFANGLQSHWTCWKNLSSRQRMPITTI